MKCATLFVTSSSSSGWVLGQRNGWCERCSCYGKERVVSRRMRRRVDVVTAEIMETKETIQDRDVRQIRNVSSETNGSANGEYFGGEKEIVEEDRVAEGDGAGGDQGNPVSDLVFGKSSRGQYVRGGTLMALVSAITALKLGREGMEVVIDGFVNGPHLVIASAIGASAFIQSLTGFGFALVAVGALSQIEWIANSNVFNDLQPVAATFGSVIGWGLLLPEIQKVNWKKLLPLLVATTLFTPVGVLGIEALGETVTLKILGSLISLFVVYTSFGIKTPKILGGRWGTIGMGALAGMFGGAFDIQGPPLVAYGDAAGWDAGNGDFRRNLLAVLSTNGTIVLLFDLLTGRLQDYYVADFVGNSIPFVIVGIAAGRFLSTRLDASGFKKLVLGLCALMGAKLLLQ
eukprot:Plantae.Rhodophyta-Hildenbrandia_rubra.ctg2621.p2 GENE.Plantae.Rhodophyta-Hildenbrandia_rubra.ctg2621~~Plantae.Rhodophyta-Hildenbrandia_rubra.ctg2621.p2  ORF type:complete len:402 (-),score=71.83 Plantae.Rhodophyta-Hildenbrandia_rubra.ctg2621:3774-4979(-)